MYNSLYQPYPLTLWLAMLISVVGYGISNKRVEVRISPSFSYTRRVPGFVMFWLTTLFLAWFAGNIFANDVYIYRLNYIKLPQELSWAVLWKEGLGSNPLFNFIQCLCKEYLTHDPATFQLLWVGCAQILFMLTYRRYSVSMPLTAMMFISSGLFFFTGVSWKQSMAMALGFAATPLALSHKWLAYYAILLGASAIHPYILLFGIFPLFVGPKIWTKKSVLLLLAMLAAGMALSSIMDTALEVTADVFGDQHNAEWFTEDYGVKPERVIFYAICPVLAVIFWKRLNEHANPMMNAMIQMSVVSFGFMAMSLSGGANFISRMGNYFEPYTYIVLPYILLKITPDRSRKFILWSVIIIYLVFFTFLQLKRGSIW